MHRDFVGGAGALIMEMFSLENSAHGVFLPKTDFHVKQGMRGGAVFFESEPVDLSAYLVCRVHRISHWNGMFKYRSRSEIMHQLVRDHASGTIDPFEV